MPRPRGSHQLLSHLHCPPPRRLLPHLQLLLLSLLHLFLCRLSLLLRHPLLLLPPSLLLLLLLLLVLVLFLADVC